MKTHLFEPSVVDRTSSSRAAREHALVLASMGIRFEQRRVGRERLLLVEVADADEALEQLARYQDESRGWPPNEAPPPLLGNGVGAALAFALVLVLFHLAKVGWIPITDWDAAGMNDSTLLHEGEWWRPVTALCLHADLVHLAGNIVFGSLFVAGVCQLVGSGFGLLATLLSGGVGNLLNSWFRGPGHQSLGASTALFGAVGILATCQWSRRKRSPRGKARRWTYIAAGLALLGLLGVSGERTDVLAHFTGFLAGLFLGLLLDFRPIRQTVGSPAQGFAILLTLFLLGFSWWNAVRFGA
ncbi:MAG: rhomboid family intramembrane serine protease [Planctomycetota bacterium]